MVPKIEIQECLAVAKTLCFKWFKRLDAIGGESRVGAHFDIQSGRFGGSKIYRKVGLGGFGTGFRNGSIFGLRLSWF